MRDVVVIGGGLSGLAAALELARHEVAYTLIEVKPRLGGSIASQSISGAIMDSGAIVHPLANPVTFMDALDMLDLAGGIHTADDGVIFNAGTQTLIDALAKGITAPRMMRMAVSTLGELDGQFSICMENGMLLDAKSLIVAAPARFAERLFYTLTPEISHYLLDYRYDSIARVSLLYRREDAPDIPAAPPPDYPLPFIHHTTHPQRVPAGHVLIQVGVRYEPQHGVPPDVVGETAALMGWAANPVAEHIGVWAEADPAMWRDSEHPSRMAAINALLPPGVGLAGSDYIPTTTAPRLDERLESGRAAAQRVIGYLNSR